MNILSADAVLNVASRFEASATSYQVIFIEDTLTNWQQLAELLPASAEVVMLKGTEDGLAQMASYLRDRQPGSLDAIHLLTHGAEGQINLGGVTLTQDSLAEHTVELRMISQALNEEGDFLLYGCNVGAGDNGKALVQRLAAITQADVAASDNLTGSETLGGDWVLETREGAINSAVLNLDDYVGTLALTVTSNFVIGLSEPQDLVVDSQNNLYVVSYGDNSIYKFNASGGAISGGSAGGAFITPGFNVTAAAIDSAGNLYIGTASGPNSIKKYPASGGVPGNTGSSVLVSGLNIPADIIVGTDGYLYISDSGDGKVYKFSSSGGPFTSASALASATVSGAQQMYLDVANNLYVTSSDTGKVIKFTASGGIISLASPSDFITGVPAPYAITSDGTDFYIGSGDFGDGEIYKVGSAGGAVTGANLENTFSGTAPTELLWAGSNTLYATFTDNTVSKITLAAANTAPTITSGATASLRAANKTYR